jgi:hypothetical protein
VLAQEIAREEHVAAAFAPPLDGLVAEAVQVVTDHRMVLSLSATSDDGGPRCGTSSGTQRAAAVGVLVDPAHSLHRAAAHRDGDQRFMQLMDDAATAPQVFNAAQPPRARADCGFGGRSSARAAESATAAETRGAGAPRAGGGAVRGAGDPRRRPHGDAHWLRDNGYAVPPALEPIIDHYTAMRGLHRRALRAGEGVDRMVPIRMTMEGYQPSLPLRMIAAGVADKVGLLAAW